MHLCCAVAGVQDIQKGNSKLGVYNAEKGERGIMTLQVSQTPILGQLSLCSLCADMSIGIKHEPLTNVDLCNKLKVLINSLAMDMVMHMLMVWKICRIALCAAEPSLTFTESGLHFAE